MNVLGSSAGKMVTNSIFVTDLDGTLLTGQRLVAAEDLLALQWLRDMGSRVVIATGRSNYSFGKLLETLGYAECRAALPVDYLIFSTGAGIMDFQEKRILKSCSLGAQDVKAIVEYLDTQDFDYMIHSPIPDTRNFFYRSRGGENPDFQTRIEMYRQFAVPLGRTPLKNWSGATEVLCIVSQQQGFQATRRIRQALSRYSVIMATSPLDGKSVWIEIFAPGVSKSRATDWLCRQLKISRNMVAAVGNDYNDVDLLQWVAKGYVVANAPEELQEQFDVVCSNENKGVSQAAKNWGEALQRGSNAVSPVQE
ncbi:MAG: HAD family hydrolase, partial [Desulforhopalus sp.]